MITVRSSSCLAGRYFRPGSISTTIGDRPYQPMIGVFGYLVVSPIPGAALEVSETQIDLSVMHYPDYLRWGKLRDRSVYHTHVDGVWSIDPWTSSRISPDVVQVPTSSGYLLEGTTKLHNCGVTFWGLSASHQATYAIPDTYISGIVCRRDPMTMFNYVMFQGDYMLAYGYTPGSVAYWQSYVFPPNFMGYAEAYHRRLSTDGKSYLIDRVKVTISKDGLVFGSGKKYPLGSTDIDMSLEEPKYMIDPTKDLSMLTGSQGPVEQSVTGLTPIIEQRLRSLTPVLMSRLFEVPTEIDPGDLTSDILRQLQVVDENLLITAFELITLRADTIPWRNLKRLISEGRRVVQRGLMTSSQVERAIQRSLKQGSGLFLGIQFGVLPTVNDAKQLVNAFTADTIEKIAATRRLHSRRTSQETAYQGSAINTTVVLTAEHSSLGSDFLGTLMLGVRTLWSFGLWPDLEMAWDFLPGSFVADWFLGCDDFFTAVGNRTMVKYYPVSHTITSVRRVVNMSLEDLMPDISGTAGMDISFVQYTRSCASELPLIPLRRGTMDNPDNYWKSASALILQRGLR